MGNKMLIIGELAVHGLCLAVGWHYVYLNPAETIGWICAGGITSAAIYNIGNMVVKQ